MSNVFILARGVNVPASNCRRGKFACHSWDCSNPGRPPNQSCR